MFWGSEEEQLRFSSSAKDCSQNSERTRGGKKTKVKVAWIDIKTMDIEVEERGHGALRAGLVKE